MAWCCNINVLRCWYIIPNFEYQSLRAAWLSPLKQMWILTDYKSAIFEARKILPMRGKFSSRYMERGAGDKGFVGCYEVSCPLRMRNLTSGLLMPPLLEAPLITTLQLRHHLYHCLHLMLLFSNPALIIAERGT